MKKIYCFLSLITILVNACSYLQNEAMQIISTPNEVINLQLGSIFKLKQYNKITLYSDDDKFAIIKPIEQTEKLKANTLQDSKVVSYKLYKTKNSRDPLHSMAILVQLKESYQVEFNSNIYNTLPSINSVTERVDQPNSICYDLVQVDSIFIVDCQKGDQDYFSIGQDTYIPIQKAKNQQRKLDQMDNYILRSTVNELELYIYEENTVQLLKILNQATLIQLLKKDTFKLEIRDFKTHSNGQISILNSQGELIIIEYHRQEDQWVLINNIDTKTQNAIAYDFDIESNQLVVIQEQNLYFKSKTSQEYMASITLEEKNSVYLTQNYILLSRSDSLVLYNQKLEKLYSMLLDQSKYKLISNPNLDSILALDDTDIYRYTINSDYYLRFRSDQLQEEYSQVQIAEEYNLPKCYVTIYYRVVPIDTLKMYLTQSSSALFAYGVNLDEQTAKFQPACTGPNLKFEFYNSDILKIEVKNKKDDIQTNLDSTDVIYRKAISDLDSKYAYLIQQKQNLEIEGYKCENHPEQGFGCNILFQKINFPKLEDSQKQIWWISKDGLYFANLNDKQVKVNFLPFDQKQFQEFQIIELQTQGKTISTDGSNLFILIEKDVEIYSINTQGWKKLSVGLKDVNQIFTSPYKQDLLFAYDNVKLSLYSIQYQKLTLIWFIQLESQAPISVAITNGHFSILKKQQDLYGILTYNIQNIGDIYSQRSHSLYHHAQNDITLFDSNYFNEQLYVIGTHEKTAKKAILIYKANETSLNSQFMILDTQSAQISSSNNFVFITETEANSQKFYIYFIDGNYFVRTSINTQLKQQVYNKGIKLKGKISNTDYYSTIEEVPIQLINRGVDLFSTEKEMNFTYVKDGDNAHCFNIGQSWYSGQAFDIDLKQPSGDVKLQKTLVKQEDSLQNSESIMQFDDQNLIQLFKNKIVLVSKADFKTTEFELDNQYSFINILYIQKDLIYVQATQNQQYHVKIIQYKDSKFSLLTGSITFNYYIKKAFQNQDRFFIWILNYVIAYDTKDDPTNFNEFKLILRVFPFQYPQSIEIQHIKHYVYYFYCIGESASFELIAYDVAQTTQKNFFQTFNLAASIKGQGMFIPLDFKCTGLVMNENLIVITFNNSISYAYEYKVDCSTNELCSLSIFKYKNSYQQYGSWSLNNEYQSQLLRENILALVYQSEKNHELLFYDLNDDTNKTGPLSAIAYVKSQNLQDQKTVQSFVYQHKGQLHVLSSAENKDKLEHHILRRSTQLCIEMDSVQEDVQTLLKNSQQEAITNLRLNIELIEPEPSHFKVWIILVIVVVFVILGISVIIYCQKKRRRQGKQKLLTEV
ncbi:unnamed protein product (macronuclear) [Paramecium tetraurelia]|uniref:Transmembrane protein n=1 Tax=Paramecium tetraurelia TaxID=5888 RepID=A0DLT4_PARTE|nr:uncharacterized protein GSPATT00039633001 [Paramecium tetraurelia]CAK84001.1 unnamed protein product [Paramecium tetraurelia]|eukprot:XP_001451398.1 hypothetical protein (macronuclear) [Paramecium tetraurelia strain d4-2]